MKHFLYGNRVFAVVFTAAAVTAGAIWFFSSNGIPAAPVSDNNQPPVRKSAGPPAEIQTSPLSIDYTKAPDHIGEYVCVTGVVDHVDTTAADTVFLSFCVDGKTCPFNAVIFKVDSPKFLDPSMYLDKQVQITGSITYYNGLVTITLTDPAQIKIIQ